MALSEVGDMISHVDWQFVRVLKECHIYKFRGDISHVKGHQSCYHVFAELDHDKSKSRDLLN